MLHAAEVAEPLLPNDAHEPDVVVRLDARFLHRAQRGQHDDEPSSIVTDSRGEERVSDLTDRDVGALREDRVEVPAEADGTLARSASTKPDDVSFGVSPDRVGPELP